MHRFLVETLRVIARDKKAAYFKRCYPDGRVRPMRLAANAFMSGHIARATARDGEPPPD